MITLKSDLITVEVKKDNPLYSVLAKFVGELFLVQKDKEETKEEKKEKVEVPVTQVIVSHETEPVQVNIKAYLDRLDTLYINDKSIVKSILKQHALRFFGAAESSTTGVYAAILEKGSGDYATCVRVIDNSIVYLTLERKMVTRT